MTSRPFTLGSRGSPLALAQARMTAAALEAAHGWAPGTVQITVIRTSGDRIQDRPLSEVGGKALWTKELDLALLGEETDASVHSMKDVESDRPGTLTIAAMLPRADVRDRLIGAASIGELREGAVIGTSSPRRAAEIRRVRPDLQVVSIRGNVDTRLAKQANGDVDATLLAAAGLDRLGRGDVGLPIPVEEMLPAPGQGAIGIECRADDVMTSSQLSKINHLATWEAVQAERAFALTLGGTCHSPVGAYADFEGDVMRLRCALLSEDGRDCIAEEIRFAVEDRDRPVRLARDMLARAPASIRTLFEARD